MHYIRAILPLVLTVILVYVLDKPMGNIPALGRLLDPVNGAMANAEPADNDFNAEFQFPNLNGKATVWFDDRLVPHLQASNNHDLYFMQGYIHAKFRLWQMDLQTRAAAGRISEILGAKALKYDRNQRLKGMVYGAEQSLKAIQEDKRTAVALNAYSEGVNYYISQLKSRDYPIEYKLMGFAPEPWTNIKTALLLMYMADDLTGDVHDIALSYLKEVLSPGDMRSLFPERNYTSTPVIPKGTFYNQPSLKKHDVPPGDIWTRLTASVNDKQDYETGKGSNNWAISGNRTKRGNAILCNDPHLGLNLPSLWYEMQLQTPDMNVYGVSLPGAPCIVIGFNDSVSWGFTNNYRDVKDFYEVDVVSNDIYRFNGQDKSFDKRVEVIKVKGEADIYDTVNYTLHGPLMYDIGKGAGMGENITGKPLALKWMAHNATNELLSIYLLNRSKNYDDYVNAIHHFECPAQNFLYADRSGNIALWGQGQFVNKWKEQGRYIMKGYDSSTLWKELIPMNENPHVYNPAQGYLSSANQVVTDTTYPYWYNGKFVDFRAWRINQVLDTMHSATVSDMFALQNDVYSILAEKALPVMLSYVENSTVKKEAYINELKDWNYQLSADSKAASSFQVWWYYFYNGLWKDNFSKIKGNIYPSDEVTMHLFVNDTTKYNYIQELLVKSFNQAVDSLSKLDSREWYRVKNTTIKHLTKLPAFSYQPMNIGGWGNTVNAVKGVHGPSWRMVVEMGKDSIRAYGLYPGGQSGNPASKYYGTTVDKWAAGEYYRLLFLPNMQVQKNNSIKYKWKVQPK